MLEKDLEILNRIGPEDYEATLSVQTNILDSKINDRELPDTCLLYTSDAADE